MDTPFNHQELADTLRAVLKPGANLPPRIELRNERTQVRLTVRYFPNQGRVAITLDSIARSRKAFIGSMNVRGVQSLELDRESGKALFRLAGGEMLVIYADARFSHGVSAP